MPFHLLRSPLRLRRPTSPSETVAPDPFFISGADSLPTPARFQKPGIFLTQNNDLSYEFGPDAMWVREIRERRAKREEKCRSPALLGSESAAGGNANHTRNTRGNDAAHRVCRWADHGFVTLLWWRRRESNPGPALFVRRVYVCRQ